MQYNPRAGGTTPLSTALYHTDDWSPSVTSPISDAFGATKMSVPSLGFMPSKGSSVRCFDTAPQCGAGPYHPEGLAAPLMADF